ncbi:MAG: RNA 2'-phosphotransferase [bacterium]
MDTSVSKTLSYLLRHHPGDENLTIDAQGFVPSEELAKALRDRGFERYDAERLLQEVASPDVERFERKGEAIRATYGHSIDVQLEYEPVEPESPLFHGTSRKAWSSIQDEGIKPMNRQYVHLSRTKEEARRVGHRRDDCPVILTISIPANTEHKFYRAGPVVLTEFVPAEWLTGP